MEEKRNAFFLGVSNKERNNIAYSNFVYSLVYYCLRQVNTTYDYNDFNRHDMIIDDNTRYSVYKHIMENDLLIILLDEMPLNYTDKNGNPIIQKMYNPNVWFELGIAAAQLNKRIILISRDVENPFYAKDVQVCVIDSFIEEKYLSKNIDFFFCNNVDNKIKKEWYEYWSSINEKCSEEHSKLKTLIDRIIEKLKSAKNPFIQEMQIMDFTKLLSPIGEGDIYKLLRDYVGETVAKFIPGEEKAFYTLTEAISKAKKSLQTTRFANRSIVSGLEKNRIHHEKFMNTLYSKSREKEINSERIICNNNYTKWKDVFEILCHGGNTKVYIRKEEYSTYFELVIVDKKTTFIHFYQLSTKGKDEDEKKKSPQDHQVINSTLMLEGGAVAENMSQVFERLYKRSSTEPSRTLLGIPSRDEEIAKKKDWSGYGMLTMPDTKSNNLDIRRAEVSQLLVNKFKEWYKYMDDEDDIFNMCLGVSLQVCLYNPFSQLLSFIKKVDYLNAFIPKVKAEYELIEKNASENEGYKTLIESFRILIDELEKTQ